MDNLNTFVKNWIPPILLKALNVLLKRSIHFKGIYSGWTEAEKNSTGYSSAIILKKVFQAMQKVKSGEAVFERDSILFDEIQYSYPLLAGLLRSGIENNTQLSVLDFGGSLGSTYYQCRKYLSVIKKLQWGIVEQKNFVECGKENFENKELHFYSSMRECKKALKPKVVIFSSVLQYLPDPYNIIDEAIREKYSYLIIDRTPFSEMSDDLITVQIVPKSIYPASYPCWVFSKKKLQDRIHGKYEIIDNYDSREINASINGIKFKYHGFLLRKR